MSVRVNYRLPADVAEAVRAASPSATAYLVRLVREDRERQAGRVRPDWATWSEEELTGLLVEVTTELQHRLAAESE